VLPACIALCDAFGIINDDDSSMLLRYEVSDARPEAFAVVTPLPFGRICLVVLVMRKGG